MTSARPPARPVVILDLLTLLVIIITGFGAKSGGEGKSERASEREKYPGVWTPAAAPSGTCGESGGRGRRRCEGASAAAQVLRRVR